MSHFNNGLMSHFNVCMYVCVCVCVCACACARVRMHACMHVCMYACMHIYMYVSIITWCLERYGHFDDVILNCQNLYHAYSIGGATYTLS